MLKICSKISLCFACAMAIGLMVSKNEYYYLFIPCATLAHFIGEWLTDKSEEYDLRNPLPLDTSYSHNRTNSNSYCVEPMTDEERNEWYKERGWTYYDTAATTDYTRYRPPTQKQTQEMSDLLASKCSRNVTISIAQ